MMIVSQFRQLNLSVVNVRTYLFAVLFVGGNMLLPQLCHLMPDGGKIFLPIYFFTLIASYKFGLKVLYCHLCVITSYSGCRRQGCYLFCW